MIVTRVGGNPEPSFTNAPAWWFHYDASHWGGGAKLARDEQYEKTGAAGRIASSSNLALLAVTRGMHGFTKNY
jgi:hypothetical protein